MYGTAYILLYSGLCSCPGQLGEDLRRHGTLLLRLPADPLTGLVEVLMVITPYMISYTQRAAVSRYIPSDGGMRL